MPKSLPTWGPVLYYLFPRDYPICDSHVQKLRGKHHVAVLSGRPPRHPGNNPKQGAKESDRSYTKRLLQWKLKADVYGRTMGSILSPWDRHGDCRIHSYDEFEQQRDLIRSHLNSVNIHRQPIKRTRKKRHCPC